MSATLLSPRAPCPRPSLRVRLRDLLPPRAAGPGALSELASHLKELCPSGEEFATEGRELLAEGLFGASDELIRRLRQDARGLSEEGAEEVLSGLALRLDRLFHAWRRDCAFFKYLQLIGVRDAWAMLKREQREQATLDEPIAPEVDEQDSPLRAFSAKLQVQALLRFAWYLWGSPDNPQRLQYDKAMVDFLALSTRLSGGSFDELVARYQPRPGSWGPGLGEPDRKWWRGRASMAQRRLQDALEDARTRQVYDRILADLLAAEAAEEAPAHSAGPKNTKAAPMLPLKPGAPTRSSAAPSSLASWATPSEAPKRALVAAAPGSTATATVSRSR